MTNSPHVLFIPSWYPVKEDPLMGFFFQEMAAALKAGGLGAGVIYPEVRPLKEIGIKKLLQNYGQISHGIEADLPTFRQHSWNLFPKMPKRQMQQWTASAVKLFKKYLSKYGKPDLLHAHSSLWGGAAAHLIGQEFDIPYAITEHRSNFLHQRALSKPIESCWSTPYLQKIWDGADLPMAVSNTLAKAVLPYTRQLKRPFSVVPVPVDTDFFTPLKTCPAGPFRFFCLSKLVPGKNIDLLVHAFHQLASENPSVMLEIGGFGPDEKRLSSLVTQLKMEKNILFLGQLDRVGVKNAFSRAHAFCLASDFETLGCVFLEALSMGLPLVGTSCGGPSEIIHQKNGLLSAVGDEPGLYHNLKEMLKIAPDFSKEALRQEALEKYSQAAMLKTMDRLYKEVLSGRL